MNSFLEQIHSYISCPEFNITQLNAMAQAGMKVMEPRLSGQRRYLMSITSYVNRANIAKVPETDLNTAECAQVHRQFKLGLL